MKKNYTLFYLLAVILISTCSAPLQLNDFFGVNMQPHDEAKFRITSYSQQRGATYTGTPTMEPNLYAYAEIVKKDLILKITNNTPNPVEMNYQTDQFFLYTKDGKEFVLRKPQIDKYPGISALQPGKSIELTLMLPSDFWKVVGMTSPNLEDVSLIEDFWQGLDKQTFLKEKIDKIKILLANKTLILLKPLPEQQQ